MYSSSGTARGGKLVKESSTRTNHAGIMVEGVKSESFKMENWDREPSSPTVSRGKWLKSVPIGIVSKVRRIYSCHPLMTMLPDFAQRGEVRMLWERTWMGGSIWTFLHGNTFTPLMVPMHSEEERCECNASETCPGREVWISRKKLPSISAIAHECWSTDWDPPTCHNQNAVAHTHSTAESTPMHW